MDNLIKRAVKSMDWMLKDIDYRNEQCEKVEESPELKEARQVFQDMKNYIGE